MLLDWWKETNSRQFLYSENTGRLTPACTMGEQKALYYIDE